MKLLLNLSIIIGSLLFVYQTNNYDHSLNLNSKKDTLDPPTILLPFNGQFLDDDTCRMYWSSRGENISYEIMLSKTYDFKKAATATSNDTILKKRFQSAEYGTYYWKVRAKNKKTVSAWSTTYSFNVGLAQIKIDNYKGCSGNCGSCPHPCSRRPEPDYYNDPYKIEKNK